MQVLPYLFFLYMLSSSLTSLPSHPLPPYVTLPYLFLLSVYLPTTSSLCISLLTSPFSFLPGVLFFFPSFPLSLVSTLSSLTFPPSAPLKVTVWGPSVL